MFQETEKKQFHNDSPENSPLPDIDLIDQQLRAAIDFGEKIRSKWPNYKDFLRENFLVEIPEEDSFIFVAVPEGPLSFFKSFEYQRKKPQIHTTTTAFLPGAEDRLESGEPLLAPTGYYRQKRKSNLYLPGLAYSLFPVSAHSGVDWALWSEDKAYAPFWKQAANKQIFSPENGQRWLGWLENYLTRLSQIENQRTLTSDDKTYLKECVQNLGVSGMWLSQLSGESLKPDQYGNLLGLMFYRDSSLPVTKDKVFQFLMGYSQMETHYKHLMEKASPQEREILNHPVALTLPLKTDPDDLELSFGFSYDFQIRMMGHRMPPNNGEYLEGMGIRDPSGLKPWVKGINKKRIDSSRPIFLSTQVLQNPNQLEFIKKTLRKLGINNEIILLENPEDFNHHGLKVVDDCTIPYKKRKYGLKDLASDFFCGRMVALKIPDFLLHFPHLPFEGAPYLSVYPNHYSSELFPYFGRLEDYKNQPEIFKNIVIQASERFKNSLKNLNKFPVDLSDGDPGAFAVAQAFSWNV